MSLSSFILHTSSFRRWSMSKMPDAGEDHRQAMFVARLDRVGVAHRAAGLNDRGDAGACGLINVVAEGKERIRCQHRTLAPLTRFAHRNLDRIDAAHLSS